MGLDHLTNLVVGALALLGIPIAFYVAVAHARRHVRRLNRGDGDGAGVDRADHEALVARVSELEERLDFAERLLAQERDRARLAGSLDD